MSFYIELLDENSQAVDGQRSIIDVAVPFLEKYLGNLWRNAEFPILLLLPYPCEDNNIYGEQPLTYHTDPIGFIQVRIVRGGRVYYYHPHTVAEVLESGLLQWLAELGASGKPVGYRIAGPDIAPLISQSTPIPKGVAEIAPYEPGERPAFRIRPIPPEPPSPVFLSTFKAVPSEATWANPADQTDFVKVLVNKELQEDLERHRPFSQNVEEGGFLVGQIYEDQDLPGTFIAHITDAVPAEQVGASFLHFTFTGDSFELIKQRLDSRHRGQRLLGWYHTHLFPATQTIGLSSIDLRLHFTTFRIPWQIAGLLNLDDTNRVLRFYVRQKDTMALCHHQPVTEDNRQ